MITQTGGSPAHLVCICTYNRLQDTLHTIGSLITQKVDFNLLVVSSGIYYNYKEIVRQKFNLNLSHFHIENPSLAKQRNIGLKHFFADRCIKFLTFVDDDVTLHRNYLSCIEKKFMEFDDAIVIGGKISNLKVKNTNILHKFIFNQKKNQGKVLKNGLNIMNITGDKNRKCDWVSGCTFTIIKRINIREIKFDENLDTYEAEDVNFCLEMKTFGEIYWSPDCTYDHRESKVSRPEPTQILAQNMQGRYKLARKFPEKISHGRITIYFLRMLIIHLLLGVVTQKNLHVQHARTIYKNLIKEYF